VKPAVAVSLRFRTLLVAACLLAAASALTAAPPAKALARAASSRSTVITGSAWGANNAPLPGAHVQLRNVIDGKIIARTIADDTGHFAFSELEGGTYIVEMVTEAGKIMSVGHAFSIAPGETVATFVRLGTRTPWFPAFFSSASSVTSSAAAQGVTALTTAQAPLSPPSSGALTGVK